MKIFRHRTALVWLVPIVFLVLLWVTDPDGGASVKAWLLRLASAFLIIAFAHWVRKAQFDYPESDMRTLFRIARETSTGAGLALIALSIFVFGVLMLFSGRAGAAQDARTVIPAQAQPYLPLLAAERQRWWADHPQPGMLAALIEHESGCPSMPKKCWNPGSSLKAARKDGSREEGAGFGQITRAWRADGSQRFDALQEMVERHPALAGWTWQNVYSRPDLQLRAVVLKVQGDFKALRAIQDPAQRLIFADVAYNRGLGGVQDERRACNLKAGCDPQRWFGHVELVCLASRVSLYGQRSACDISREHPVDVLARTPKYAGLV